MEIENSKLYQLYIIYRVIEEQVYPLDYCLCKRKSEEAYTTMKKNKNQRR